MRASLWITFAVAVATAATGCFVGNDPPGDDGDDGGGGGGLTIEWNGQPSTIPSEPSSDITIDRAVFHLDDLRLVGDAGPIDLDRDKLEWSRGIVPTALPVMGALPGLYSRLLFDLDGSDDGEVTYAYEITGTVKVNDSFQPYTLRDTSDLTLSLDFSIMLPAGGIATIPVRIEINKVVEVINFSQVSTQDGRYLVDDTSPQISNVRAAVRAAFSVSGPS
jgi:hypothetical protein